MSLEDVDSRETVGFPSSGDIQNLTGELSESKFEFSPVFQPGAGLNDLQMSLPNPEFIILIFFYFVCVYV